MGINAYLDSCVTAQGYDLAVACLALDAGRNAHELLSRMHSVRFRDEDIFNIDYTLARYIKSYADECIVAVGASVSIPGIAPQNSSGGVIGSPHLEIVPNKSGWERIGHGLLLYSKPEGPGVIVEEDGAHIGYVSDALASWGTMPAEAAAERLLARLSENYDGCYMIVCDGSSECGPGVVAVGDGVYVGRVVFSGNHITGGGSLH